MIFAYKTMEKDDDLPNILNYIAERRLHKMAKTRTPIWTFLAIGLLIGWLVSYGFFPRVVTEEKVVEKVVEVPTDPEVVTETKTIEVPLDAVATYRDTAYQTIIDEIGDEDDFLTCEGYIYDDDEFEVTKWYDEWSVGFNDDQTIVEFTAKFRFDTNDDRPCKEVRTYQVITEEGEDPIITLL